jgi:predicted TIM-barrel fold metal-dependent hydrolase
MNVDPKIQNRTKAAAKLAVADCDIHPVTNAKSELYPFMDEQWQKVLETYGPMRKRGVQVGSAYPKSQRDACRRDAWPENGNAGGDLSLMQSQHLDPNNITLGLLNPLGAGSDFRHPGLGTAYARAVNDWQVAKWTSKDSRLKASVVVQYGNAYESALEIQSRAHDPNFYHVLLLSRTGDPAGHQRYWPIYEAAEAAGFPVGLHAFGDSGSPATPGGWPSFYFEEMFGHAASCQGVVASMVLEGVFERFPKLKVLIIEAGVAWLAALTWRLDKIWLKQRDETYLCKRLPSEYIRNNIWITTQPIEEPEPRDQLLETLDWIGWDKVCFASDYPHWDFDDPMFALPLSKLTQDQREKFLFRNAFSLYGERAKLAVKPIADAPALAK